LLPYPISVSDDDGELEAVRRTGIELGKSCIVPRDVSRISYRGKPQHIVHTKWWLMRRFDGSPALCAKKQNGYSDKSFSRRAERPYAKLVKHEYSAKWADHVSQGLPTA